MSSMLAVVLDRSGEWLDYFAGSSFARHDDSLSVIVLYYEYLEKILLGLANVVALA